MREIKFRAWTGRMMEYWDHIKAWESLGHHLGVQSAFKWMQFTGLRDRYNMPIYEGDIVKTCRRVGRGYRDNAIEAVRYSEITARWYPLDIVVKERCEVIGDIYRNPELLP